jgi:hypothetical protein
MITYKNTSSNVTSYGIDSLQQQIKSNPKVRKARVELINARIDQDDFETVVLGYMCILQREAETSHNDSLDELLKSLKNQLAEKKPNIDEILDLFNNTRV